MFGNTAQVARAIAEGMRTQDAEVEVVPVVDARPDALQAYDVVVIGAPTHAVTLSRPSTRADAGKKGAQVRDGDAGCAGVAGRRGGSPARGSSGVPHPGGEHAARLRLRGTARRPDPAAAPSPRSSAAPEASTSVRSSAPRSGSTREARSPPGPRRQAPRRTRSGHRRTPSPDNAWSGCPRPDGPGAVMAGWPVGRPIETTRLRPPGPRHRRRLPARARPGRRPPRRGGTPSGEDADAARRPAEGTPHRRHGCWR